MGRDQDDGDILDSQEQERESCNCLSPTIPPDLPRPARPTTRCGTQVRERERERGEGHASASRARMRLARVLSLPSLVLFVPPPSPDTPPIYCVYILFGGGLLTLVLLQMSRLSIPKKKALHLIGVFGYIRYTSNEKLI